MMNIVPPCDVCVLKLL